MTKMFERSNTIDSRFTRYFFSCLQNHPRENSKSKTSISETSTNSRSFGTSRKSTTFPGPDEKTKNIHRKLAIQLVQLLFGGFLLCLFIILIYYLFASSLLSMRKQDIELINQSEIATKILGNNIDYIPSGNDSNKINYFINERGFKAKSYSFGIRGTKSQTIVHVEREKENSIAYKYRFFYIESRKGPIYIFKNR